MSTVVIMGKWSDDSACRAVHNVRLESVPDSAVMSGDDARCSVVFGTLAGVFVFSAMWYELPMTSATSCPPWSPVHECQRVECAFTSPARTECGMFVMHCMQCRMSVSAAPQCVDVVSRGGI